MTQVDYGEDFLQRIVGVHWRKPGAGLPYATFVFGGFGSDFFGTGGVLTIKVVRTAISKDDADAKYKLESSIVKIPLANKFEPVASSYAVVTPKIPPPGKLRVPTPTFLVAGNRTETVDDVDSVGNPIHVTLLYTMIYCSNDGLSWSQVFEGPPPPKTDSHDIGSRAYGNPLALVWDSDSKAFYFDVLTFTGPYTARISSDTIFTSRDGRSWSEVSRTNTDNSLSYVSTFPSSYCRHNDCIDDNGNNVPDGIMKDDPIAKVLMKPQQPPIINYGVGSHSFEFSFGGDTYGSSVVEINDKGLLEHYTASMPGMPKVFCVAGVHGIWMAGGAADPGVEGGALAVSVDRGKNWTAFTSPQGAILTMVAGTYA